MPQRRSRIGQSKTEFRAGIDDDDPRRSCIPPQVEGSQSSTHSPSNDGYWPGV